MSDNAARNKVPLPNQVMVPRPKPPPLRRRSRRTDLLSRSGSREVVPATDEAVEHQAPAPGPVHSKPFSFADFPDDEDQTAAFEVPEELLRRSRVGKEPIPSRISEVPMSDRTQAYQMPPGFADDDKAPDSRANTSPPPPAGEGAAVSPSGSNPGVEAGGLGRVFQQADASEKSSRRLALVADYAADLIDDDDESGEFTRIGHDGELEHLSMQLKEAKVPNVIVSDEHTSLEATRTKVRAKQNVPQATQSNGLLWGIIGVLLLATSVLAVLLVKAI